MIIFVALFILVVVISFILAYLSMKDYKQVPKLTKKEYSLFLIRKSINLTNSVLESISTNSKKANFLISLERSFKNGKSALTIFGPKSFLLQFSKILDLLELEDYTKVPSSDVSVWEVGLNYEKRDTPYKINFFNLPALSNEEQVWFQLIIKSQKKNAKFLCQIRVACLDSDLLRRKAILEQLIKPPLVKIPRPYSNENLLKFYQDRLMEFDKHSLNLNSEDILRLISLN